MARPVWLEGCMPTVMIVDDDQTMTSLLSTLLQLDGYDVIQASTRDVFLNHVADGVPDAILMDVFIGETDGLELVQQLRASTRRELADVPVIMTSGMDLADRCEQAGANAFLLKPYDPEQLLGVIHKQLGDG